MAPRETENNAYAKFWGVKQRTLWYMYVMVFYVVVNRFIKQNNKFARASRFFVHFFAVSARLRRENA